MKAKIAKLEGDSRSAKKMTEMLERQVKMLEHAIKRERATSKALKDGKEPPPMPPEEEVKTNWNGHIGLKPSCENTFLIANSHAASLAKTLTNL